MDIFKNPEDITTGSIKNIIIRLSIPVFFANLLQVSYKLIDLFFVGRLGKEAIAAISLSFPILFLIVSFSIGFAIAGNILISQHKGNDNDKKVNYVATQTIIFTLFLSLILGFIGYIITPNILSLMSLEPLVYNYSLQYMRIYFIGLVFLFMYGMSQGIMRGIGDVKTPLIIITITVILNILLDPILIFGLGPFPALEVRGAALATIISQAISAILCFILFISNKYKITIDLKNYKFDLKIIKKVIKLGIPSSLETTARALATSVLVFIITNLGTVTTAAYGIGAKVFNIVTIPAFAISTATTTIVGQNIGANQTDRAVLSTKKSIKYSLYILISLGVILFLFSSSLASIFTNEIPVIEQTSTFIRFISFSIWLLGIQVIINGTLRGAGDTKTAMYITIITLWFVRIPLVLFLTYVLNLKEIGVWLSFPISELIAVIISVFVIVKGTWYNKKLINH